MMRQGERNKGGKKRWKECRRRMGREEKEKKEDKR